MTDIVDIATERIDADTARRIAAARAAADTIPQGAPGDCDLCGEWAGRLVAGACAHCRDRYRLP